MMIRLYDKKNGSLTKRGKEIQLKRGKQLSASLFSQLHPSRSFQIKRP
jgi:hypothetical protein